MGPLAGIKVIEMAGLGPGPFCAMMLADMGAEIVRIDRAGSHAGFRIPAQNDYLLRGRRSLAVDLKSAGGAEVILRLGERADVLIEGFRPGVMERLGLGPEDCMARNRALIYGRMTGWGQDGPWAKTAGHDINYIALSGVLSAIGPADQNPVPPLNLIADYGGGGMMLAFAIAAALFERTSSGQGQIIDAAMIDGSALMMNSVLGLREAGLWSENRGGNLLDGGAPFYATYETADGKYMAVGALEPQFYDALLDGLGLDRDRFMPQHDRAQWPRFKQGFAAAFATRSRDQWAAVFEHNDACVAPVLDLMEAARHPHNAARSVFARKGGGFQAAPAPRFSRNKAEMPGPPPQPGEHSREILSEWGFSAAEINALCRAGTVKDEAESGAVKDKARS